MAGSPHPSGAAGRGEAQSRMTRPKMLPPANRQRIASFFLPDHRSANVVPNRHRIAQIVTLRTATASLSFVRDLSS